jgi:hypothetical protein
MSIVYETVVSVAKETKSDEVTLEKTVADIFEAEPRLYDLYRIEKEYEDTPIEKSGTSEGAIAGWDTRGRGRKTEPNIEETQNDLKVPLKEKLIQLLIGGKEKVLRELGKFEPITYHPDGTPKTDEERYDDLMIELRDSTLIGGWEKGKRNENLDYDFYEDRKR